MEKELRKLLDSFDISINIGIHDACFHADELVAVSLIEIAYPDKYISYTRSRDTNILKTMDVCIDVSSGDPSLDFDHHQANFWGKWYNGQKYASTGLTWCAVCDYIANRYIALRIDSDAFNDDIKKHLADEFIKKLDPIFQKLDMHDNGELAQPGDLITLPKIVYTYNYPDVNNDIMQNRQFEDAKLIVDQLLKQLFIRTSIDVVNEYKAEEIIKQSISEHEEYIVLPSYLNWRSFMINHLDEYPNTKLIIWPAKNKHEYRIQTIPSIKTDWFSMRVQVKQHCGYQYNPNNILKCSDNSYIGFIHPKGFTGSFFCTDGKFDDVVNWWLNAAK